MDATDEVKEKTPEQVLAEEKARREKKKGTPIPRAGLTPFEVEQIVNNGAQKIADKYGIPKSWYRVCLVSKTRGNARMILQRGHTVMIYIHWPHVGKELPKLLHVAFQQIAEKGLRDAFALVKYVDVLKEHKVRREWYQSTFGDIGDVIADLVEPERVSVKHEVKKVCTMMDNVTGESVTIEYNEKRLAYDVEREARILLSHKVKNHVNGGGEHA